MYASAALTVFSSGLGTQLRNQPTFTLVLCVVSRVYLILVNNVVYKLIHCPLLRWTAALDDTVMDGIDGRRQRSSAMDGGHEQWMTAAVVAIGNEWQRQAAALDGRG